ncbi:Dimeric alpha-beta barrel [Penicillium sp. DV-2018c]|nr:Dimeric alpha-beta barrel [Penicillium sp. DV-2018c]KAJ5581650.1 Dimeric alpha-beta barrel [Penicillium sp. DV-2018c]
MVLVHIVLFKFRADVGDEVKQEFLTQIKTLRSLSCVKSQRLVVGGPSITTPAEKSKGFHYALVSYHENQAALAEYQASSEHERVTGTYFIPYKEDLVRFDFETDQADETLLGF